MGRTRTEPHSLTRLNQTGSAWLSSRLLSLLLCGLLLGVTGCTTTFSPTRLWSYTEDVTTLRTEPAGEPAIHLTPHSDGLGWTAHVMVPERVHQAVQVKEMWEGKELKIPFHPIVVELFGLLCPIGIVSGMVGGISHPEDPSWVRGYEMCGGGPTHRGDITHVHDTQTLTNRVSYRQRQDTTGHLQLRWQQPNRNPLIVDVPVQPGTGGTVLRLPWLADAMIRNGWPLDTTLDGTGQIVFEGTDGIQTTSAFPITADTLRAANAQMLWRAPDARWPRTLQVRIGQEETLRDKRRSPIPMGLITQRLLGRQIHVVTRDETLDTVMTTQRQQLLPTYRDTAPSPGHLTAATVLLQLAVHQSPQRWQVTGTAVAIDSGQILGTVTLEDHADQWDRLMESLSSLLPDLLAPDTTRREGSFTP